MTNVTENEDSSTEPPSVEDENNATSKRPSEKPSDDDKSDSTLKRSAATPSGDNENDTGFKRSETGNILPPSGGHVGNHYGSRRPENADASENILMPSSDDIGNNFGTERPENGTKPTSITPPPGGGNSKRPSEGTEFEDEFEYLTTPAAPDGGYGWVIVFASFMCDCMADGVAFSFGVLMDEFLDYFRESNSKTSWVGSLFHGIPLIAGPLASALITRYGCRRVCIAGGILTSLGFVISFFAVNIDFLCFSFGVISGFGLSLVYTPAVVIVAFYFDKKRSFATGLAASGSGIGSLIFAPLMEYLIGVYGWKGTLWIVGGIMLNFVVCGALFRPVETKTERTIRKNLRTFHEIRSRHNSEAQDSPLDSSLVERYNGYKPNRTVRNRIESSPIKSVISIPTFVDDGAAYRETHEAADDIRVNLNYSSKPSTSSYRPIIVENGFIFGRYTEKSDSNIKNGSLGRQDENVNNICSCFDVDTSGCDSPPIVPDPARSSTLSAQHKNLAHYVSNARIMVPLPDYQHGGVSFSCPNVHGSEGEYSKLVENNFAPQPIENSPCCDKKLIRGVLREMFDPAVITQPVYLLFFISNFILYMWFDVAYFFLPEYATQMGISPQRAAWSIAIMGIMNTIGQIFFGYLGDRPSLRTVYVYACAVGLCGLATTFAPLCTDFATICIYSALFGFFIGADYALCSVIIIDILSLDQLTNAYGMMMCGQGIANLIGPPIAGLLFDHTGSYDATFITGGVCIALAGLIMFSITLVEKCDKRRRERHLLQQDLSSKQCSHLAAEECQAALL